MPSFIPLQFVNNYRFCLLGGGRHDGNESAVLKKRARQDRPPPLALSLFRSLVASHPLVVCSHARRQKLTKANIDYVQADSQLSVCTMCACSGAHSML